MPEPSPDYRGLSEGVCRGFGVGIVVYSCKWLGSGLDMYLDRALSRDKMDRGMLISCRNRWPSWGVLAFSIHSAL